MQNCSAVWRNQQRRVEPLRMGGLQWAGDDINAVDLSSLWEFRDERAVGLDSPGDPAFASGNVLGVELGITVRIEFRKNHNFSTRPFGLPNDSSRIVIVGILRTRNFQVDWDAAMAPLPRGRAKPYARRTRVIDDVRHDVKSG